MAWDAAGCSFKQAEAINKHTDWEARHFRVVKTFYDCLDIGPENYNRDEFIALIEEADILHFCSATHTYSSEHNFGFNWNDIIQGKIKIFHDYNSFMGRWSDRADAKDLWNKRKEIEYNAIFSSIPQCTNIYDGCIYIPDVVDELSVDYTPSNINRNTLIIGHFPSGGGNNKNTNEFKQALDILSKDHINIDTRIVSGIEHSKILNVKKECTMGFDALWRGFHGMTTVENLALGIPTMTAIDGNFEEIFKIFHQTDYFPFEIVNNVSDIVNCIKTYYNEPDMLVKKSEEVRKFMVEKWSYKNIANRIVAEYNKLLNGE